MSVKVMLITMCAARLAEKYKGKMKKQVFCFDLC